MSVRFRPYALTIVVQVRLSGPTGDIYARLALDTGASTTTVRNALLTTIGYDLDSLPKNMQMTTGSGVEAVALLTVDKIEAMEQERTSFPIVVHTLPPSAGIDGLLGLDFFRTHILKLDFVKGEATLKKPPVRIRKKNSS